MNKKFLNLIVVLMFGASMFAACGDRPIEHVVEYYISVNEKGDTVKAPKLSYFYIGDDSTNCREVQYYEDGSLKMEGYHVNGARTGVWTAWYKDGKVWSRGEYRDGLAEGTRRVYYPNGQLYHYGDYLNGKRVGEWIFYDSLGKEIKRNNY